MSLETPVKIRNLQRKLYCKAKAEPAFRFYLLFDKIHREDILRHAYGLARSNAGAPGVDGETFAEIAAAGEEAWLAGLRQELTTKTYRPAPVRRVTIPKPGGGERPLGIPTIRDRVVQTAAKLVLEPIFEADLEDSVVWLSARPWWNGPCQGSAPAVGPGLHGCGRCRSIEVLRYDPARRAPQIGGAPHRRSACALADQDVAEGTGRGDGRRW